MRTIIIILLFSFNANATTYYVSNAGSDAANGLTTGTSWQTISKVNGFTFASGDSILFKAGDSWNEALLPKSNTHFSSYGAGIKPVITGFQTLGGLVQAGNIWSTTASNAGSSLNMVLLNGTIAHKGRYPSADFLIMSGVGSTTVIATNLTGTPSYAGKEVASRQAPWWVSVRTVASQSGGNLTVSPAMVYNANYGSNGYFFQNDSSFVDTLNEFSYASNKRFSVYATTTPTVQISTIDALVTLSHKANITFDNITFTGGNKYNFKIDSCQNININSCKINQTEFGVFADSSTNINVTNDSVFDCLSMGIMFGALSVTVAPCRKITANYNRIHNIGNIIGANFSDSGNYIGILSYGDSAIIRYNVLDSIGYNGIQFVGQYDTVEGNVIHDLLYSKTDGGGIYTFGNSRHCQLGSVIRKNIIYNAIGTLTGMQGASPVVGIYPDNYSEEILVDSNTVFNCDFYASAFFHLQQGVNGVTARNNLFVDSLAYPFKSESCDSLRLYGNVYYSKKSTIECFYLTSSSSILQSDSNIYLRPTATSAMIYKNGTTYSYPAFVSATGFDTHGGTTPFNVTSAVPILLYNPTSTDSTITLSGSYFSAKNIGYTNNITLRPYTGELLFKATFDGAAPTKYFLIR